jgi:hypothetical protein
MIKALNENNRPTTYMTYRMLRSQTRLPNGKLVLDKKGSLTACCIVDTLTKTMKVGFSFMSPADQQILKRGRNRAYGRCMGSPIVLKVKKSKNKFLVTEAILKYIKEASKRKYPEDMLGIKRYYGKDEKSMFRKWFNEFLYNIYFETDD